MDPRLALTITVALTAIVAALVLSLVESRCREREGRPPLAAFPAGARLAMASPRKPADSEARDEPGSRGRRAGAEFSLAR
jgi:peptidoglycan/LPS O-acetylase OafA/YrhL